MNTLRRMLALTLTLGSLTDAMAMSTLCQIAGGLGPVPKVISWDTETKKAKYTDQLNETHIGTVTLSREHDSLEATGQKFVRGEKINLFFDYGRDYYGISTAEFIIAPVFPVSGRTHRVIGVGYSTIDGKRFLTQLIAASDAVCISH